MTTEKQPVISLPVSIIYIDSNATVTNVMEDTIMIDHSTYSRESLLQLIQKYKSNIKTKYKLYDILLYHMDLDNLDFTINDTNYLTSLSFAKDICIPPTFSIYHPIHSLYILLQEISKNQNNNKTKRKLDIICRPPKHFHGTKKMGMSSKMLES